MCFVFRDREASRHSTDIKNELRSQGFSGDDLENRVIFRRSEGEDYGLTRKELIGAYTHKYFPKLRRDRDRIDVNKVRKMNPAAVDEAEEALKNCIDLKCFKEKNDLVFLNESGRLLVGKPRWHKPFSLVEEEYWNLQLIFEYIKALAPV